MLNGKYHKWDLLVLHEHFEDDFLIELIIIIQQQSQFIFSCSQVEGEHEAGPEWDFLYLWRNGVIPADLCHRDKYC